MSDSKNEFEAMFDSKHFDSIEHAFTIENVTTRTQIKQIPKTLLVELRDKQLVLEIPKRSCAKGHSLLLTVSTKTPSEPKPFVFHATTRVDEIESQDPGTDRALLTLLQFEEKEWKKFVSILDSRQDEINQFLRAAKGY